MTERKSDELIRKMERAFYDKGLPSRMWGGMARYLFEGVPPGHFLTAVIENDLREAVARADEENRTLLYEYVLFLYNDCPSGCWGSQAKVTDWLERGGLNGK